MVSVEGQGVGATHRSHPLPRSEPQPCDGHHKMSDSGAVGEPVHSNAESGEPVYRISDRMVRRNTKMR
jgi:hypothetical protein